MSPTLVESFSALGDKTRLGIVERLLRDGEKSAGDLVETIDMTAPAVSRHLKILTNAGLITRRVDKQRRIYAANPTTIKEINQWTMDHKAFWEASLNRLEAALEDSSDE